MICQHCGCTFDGEYLYYDVVEAVDVYSCYICNGVNKFKEVE